MKICWVIFFDGQFLTSRASKTPADVHVNMVLMVLQGLEVIGADNVT